MKRFTRSGPILNNTRVVSMYFLAKFIWLAASTLLRFFFLSILMWASTTMWVCLKLFYRVFHVLLYLWPIGRFTPFFTTSLPCPTHCTRQQISFCKLSNAWLSIWSWKLARNLKQAKVVWKRQSFKLMVQLSQLFCCHNVCFIILRASLRDQQQPSLKPFLLTFFQFSSLGQFQALSS